MPITGKIGKRKYGGRVKGTPNKDTLELLQVWDEIGYDPARALLKLLPQLEPEEQAQVHLKLMKFKYPERKAVDATISNPDGSNVEIVKPMTPEELMAYVGVARAVK